MRAAACAAWLGLSCCGCSKHQAPVAAGAPGFEVTGYLPDYRVAAAEPAQLGRYYTDIILFSVEPTAAGAIDSHRLGAAAYALVSQLKQAGVQRVLLTVGGGNRSSRFAAVCADAALRQKLVRALLDFCQRKGLDGVDYDWEAPSTAAQEAAYAALIAETHATFAPHHLRVTAAVASWQHLNSAALAALDRVHVMAYDAPGEHSTYEFATGAAETWLAQGAAPAQLCLGVPFYGRGVVHHRAARTYAQIASTCQLDPLADHAGDFYFNGELTLRRKAQYARDHGLGGVMVWEVGQDTPDCALARALQPQ